MKKLPAIEELRRLLEYDSSTGILTWRISPARRVKVGDEAGWATSEGYRAVKICDRQYQVHRVAWALHYGECPAGQIDHENHIRDDNRIANLRVATNAENAKNQKLRATNTSGQMGVTWCVRSQKWAARIMTDGRRRHLGYFDYLAEACAAREAAEIKHGYHRNHGINLTAAEARRAIEFHSVGALRPAPAVAFATPEPGRTDAVGNPGT